METPFLKLGINAAASWSVRDEFRCVQLSYASKLSLDRLHMRCAQHVHDPLLGIAPLGRMHQPRIFLQSINVNMINASFQGSREHPLSEVVARGLVVVRLDCNPCENISCTSPLRKKWHFGSLVYARRLGSTTSIGRSHGVHTSMASTWHLESASLFQLFSRGSQESINDLDSV